MRLRRVHKTAQIDRFLCGAALAHGRRVTPHGHPTTAERFDRARAPEETSTERLRCYANQIAEEL
jgi:hypothetical protein